MSQYQIPPNQQAPLQPTAPVPPVPPTVPPVPPTTEYPAYPSYQPTAQYPTTGYAPQYQYSSTPGYGPTPPPEAKNKTVLVVVGIVVTFMVLIGAGTAAFFILSDDDEKKPSKETSQEKNPSKTTPTPTDEPEPEEPTEPAGYTFTMPAGFDITDISEDPEHESEDTTLQNDEGDEIEVSHINESGAGEAMLAGARTEVENSADPGSVLDLTLNLPGYVGGFYTEMDSGGVYVFADADNVIVIVASNTGSASPTAVIAAAKSLMNSLRFK